METRRIGSLTVTIVGLGCNNFDSGAKIIRDSKGKSITVRRMKTEQPGPSAANLLNGITIQRSQTGHAWIGQMGRARVKIPSAAQSSILEPHD